MFNNLGWGESAVLLILALLVFGPERLPRAAAQAGRLIRQLKLMAAGVTDDLKREIGTDALDLRGELRSLDPRRMVDPRALLDDDEPPARAAPRSRVATGRPAPYDPDAT